MCDIWEKQNVTKGEKMAEERAVVNPDKDDYCYRSLKQCRMPCPKLYLDYLKAQARMPDVLQSVFEGDIMPPEETQSNLRAQVGAETELLPLVLLIKICIIDNTMVTLLIN